MRGKELTSGQMPWDGRDEAIDQLDFIRRTSARLGRLAAAWAGLLAHDDDMRHLLLGLVDSVGKQWDVLEGATEKDYDPRKAFEAIEQTSTAIADFIQRYASTSNRTAQAVKSMLQLGEHDYIERKLAAHRWVTYANGDLSRRPPPVDPDDDESPY
jgi:hypothetical protein